MADNSNTAGNNSMTGDALEKLMERSFAQLDKADRTASKNGGDEKTLKLFGLIEVPEVVGTVAQGLWNDVSDDISRWFKRASGKQLTSIGENLGLRNTALTKAVATTQILASFFIKSSMYISPVRQALGARSKAKHELSKKSAELLDGLKGRHTVGALMGIKETDNEMLYYARERMKLTTKTAINNSITSLVVNVVPSLMVDYPENKRLWKNQNVADPLSGTDKQIQHWGGKIVRFGSAPMARVATHSNERKLNRKIGTPYSAFDMVLELAEQVESNPKASSFQLPGRGSGSVSLEHYLEQICYMHQKNMAEINTDHVEIRSALKEDVAAAVKPLAEAIRKGDLNAWSLANLIDGKVIKSRGRAIASPEDVETLIEQAQTQPAAQKHADPKTYYKDKSYTKDDLKKVVHALEGEQRQRVMRMVPAEILRDLGVGDAEIKDAYAISLPEAKRQLSETVVGIHGQSAEELNKTLGKGGQRTFDKAYAEVTEKGTHPQGVEQTILDWAVPTVLGDKEHFGTVLRQGQEKLEAMTEEGADTAANNRGSDKKASHYKNGFTHGAEEFADRTKDTAAHNAHAQREQYRTHRAAESDRYLD